MNGYLFVSLADDVEQSKTGFDRVARVANCVRVLERKAMHINPAIVEHLYDVTLRLGVPTAQMLTRQNVDAVTAAFLHEMS